MKTKRCSNNYPGPHGWHVYLVPRIDLGVAVDVGDNPPTWISVPTEKVLCVGMCPCEYPGRCEYGPYAHMSEEKVPPELSWE